ncbi:MAG TPA: sigma-70 family RNA polymerase sigma factor [Candidatus Cybelea sp.]|jgi:RNA polymerase sigma-70 factor (ECF subfamily)|nr:sigma-70 family RNA polymerase sigma factor [Candidatus Cybelea sp.]
MGPEPEAVERARIGGAALDALIEQIWPDAFRLSFAILHDRGLAEDAAQEACATIARRLDSLRANSAFSVWSCRIVARHALDVARRRPRTLSLADAGACVAPAAGADALDLHAALASLDPRRRAVILLHYYAGLSSGEIAGVLGVSPATVRFHLMRARAALRRALTVSISPPSANEVLTDAP